ncbi:MAG: sodium:proton antiporter [Leptolyngbyaceae bacterium]|nr:sodium:proton antiporter [Leptolyngbyaceae bacterium]
MTYLPLLFMIGLLLLIVTLGSGWIARLPLSYALIYLIAGVILGSHGVGWISLRPNAEFIERLTEMVVIISVFGCGLKMQRPLRLGLWQSTIRLIGLVMPLSILAIALVGHGLLNLDWGSAIILGAVLSPTDPVLASEVQLDHPDDDDDLRFGLTSEGGLNDALAFPFVYFGIYWFTKGSFDSWGKNWILIDVLWAIAAGLVMGVAVAWSIIWLERQLQRRPPVNDLMMQLTALSTVFLTYTLTEFVNGYGFLAVFVAGVVIRKCYRCDRSKRFAQAAFIEQLEKLLEVATIVLLGSLLQFEAIRSNIGPALILAIAILFVIRPIVTWISLIGSTLPRRVRLMMGWFGIRGVGSIYYLTYALGEGFTGEQANQIGWMTYTVITLSIILHGVSATPLMQWYEHHPGEKRKK